MRVSPFRSKMWRDNIKKDNQLTIHEFTVSMSDSNGQWIKVDEINELIKCGALTVDFDKLEDYIYEKTVIEN